MSHPNHLVKNLALCLLASQLTRLLAAALAVKGGQWQAHDVAMHFGQVALILLVSAMVPYQQIAAKCIVYAWLGFEVVPMLQSIESLFWVRPRPYTIVMQCGLAMLLCLWYALRSYQHPSDALDEKSIFLCRLKPRSLQDILMAMGPSGLGGMGVYYRGKFWHYSHGVLVSGVFRNQYRYVIQNAGFPKDGVIDELNKLQGMKWTAFNNCLTTLYPIVKLGHPIFRQH